MSERWIPVFAAIVGLLGGVGGAFVGGWLANEKQENQFVNERADRLRELRIDAYASYLKACEDTRTLGGPGRVATVDAAEARVLLFSDSAVRDAARELLDECKAKGKRLNEADYTPVRDRFIEQAQAQDEAETSD